ncbi:hypothetical protein [Salibacterium aidingense]|uniref:hypothetical protein n=1 Tax=Salibacterium aidingense TaxID=384933 RepID=UPI0004261E8E|nr:hypothetical protein [Salibacterium aidingense]
MQRYLYAYKNLSTEVESTFSIPANSEEEAASNIREAVADVEFAEKEEIEILHFIKTVSTQDHLYECESCT